MYNTEEERPASAREAEPAATPPEVEQSSPPETATTPASEELALVAAIAAVGVSQRGQAEFVAIHRRQELTDQEIQRSAEACAEHIAERARHEAVRYPDRLATAWAALVQPGEYELVDQVVPTAAGCPVCTARIDPDDETALAPARLLQIWHDAYRAAHEGCPTLSAHQRARAEQKLKEILKLGRSVAEIQSVLELGVQSGDRFLVETGWTIPSIAAQFDAILAAARGGRRHGERRSNSRRTPAPDGDGGPGGRTNMTTGLIEEPREGDGGGRSQPLPMKPHRATMEPPEVRVKRNFYTSRGLPLPPELQVAGDTEKALAVAGAEGEVHRG